MKRVLALAAVVVVALAAPARAETEAEKRADAVRKATFPDDKRAAVKALMELKGPEVRKQLEVLEGDGEEGWTREAALFGLVLLEDPEVDKAVAAKVDGMSERRILAAALKERKKPFPLGPLVEQFKKKKGIGQSELLELIASIGGEEAEKFLVSVVKDTPRSAFDASGLRTAAFGALVKGFPKTLRPLAVELVPDRDLGAPALAFVVENGTEKDLALCVELAKKPGEGAIAIVAYRGISRWGDAKLKLDTCLAALRGPDETRARGAVHVFGTLGVPDVVTAIARLARTGTDQRTRLAAAERLAVEAPPAPGAAKDPVAAALIGVLREEHVEKEGVPLFVKLITLGIANAFEALDRHFDKKEFDAVLVRIEEGLEKRTGAKPGKTYDAWLDWAIARGWTVDGQSLLQRLFSPSKARRLAAQDAAARLLGATGRDDFARKNAVAQDGDVSAALAKGLVAKGLLEDED